MGAIRRFLTFHFKDWRAISLRVTPIRIYRWGREPHAKATRLRGTRLAIAYYLEVSITVVYCVLGWFDFLCIRRDNDYSCVPTSQKDFWGGFGGRFSGYRRSSKRKHFCKLHDHLRRQSAHQSVESFQAQRTWTAAERRSIVQWRKIEEAMISLSTFHHSKTWMILLLLLLLTGNTTLYICVGINTRLCTIAHDNGPISFQHEYSYEGSH